MKYRIPIHSGKFVDTDDHMVEVTIYKNIELYCDKDRVSFSALGGESYISVWCYDYQAEIAPLLPTMMSWLTLTLYSTEALEGSDYNKYTYKITCAANDDTTYKSGDLVYYFKNTSNPPTILAQGSIPVTQQRKRASIVMDRLVCPDCGSVNYTLDGCPDCGYEGRSVNTPNPNRAPSHDGSTTTTVCPACRMKRYIKGKPCPDCGYTEE